MNIDLAIALIIFMALPVPGYKADPKGDFVSLTTDNHGSTITMSVSPADPNTFFSFDKESWELNFIEKTDQSYTFEIRYLKGPKLIAALRKTLLRGKIFDFEIPKGQKFHACFFNGPQNFP